MKRTGFKKKSFEEIKEKNALKQAKKIKTYKDTTKAKKPSKKAKTSQLKALKNRVWELCKQIIRSQYIKSDGTWNCYTCGRIIDVPAKAQTGHFIASSVCGAYLRYDLRNLRVQDYYCNINLGGNGSYFYKNLVSEKGQEYVNQLFIDKNKIIKADEIFFLQKIDEYEKILQELSTDSVA